MLFHNKLASIPSSPRHSISNTKDLSNPLITIAPPPITSSLQYFNIRVTERLHRYRSLKRQWNEVATAIQIEYPSNSKSESPILIPDIIEDFITLTAKKEKTSIELDPLHGVIQQDLIKLRKLIKERQKKSSESLSPKANTNNSPSREAIVPDNQEHNRIKKLLSPNKSNRFNCVQISGCQMRPSTFPQTNSAYSRIVNTSNSSTTSTQYSKEQQQKIKKQHINRIFNIYRNRINHTLPSDSLIQGVPPPKQKINTPPKIISNSTIKQTQSYRMPPPIVIKKKQSSFIQQETPLPPIQRPSIREQTATTTCLYNYAASTSSATPRSMKLYRNTSLLPILLTSSSCIGIQSRKNHSGKEISYNLVDYKHLINHLPRPIVPIIPRYDQGDYGILFEQLDHIRETMPNSNVYENYTRIC